MGRTANANVMSTDKLMDALEGMSINDVQQLKARDGQDAGDFKEECPLWNGFTQEDFRKHQQALDPALASLRVSPIFLDGVVFQEKDDWRKDLASSPVCKMRTAD